MISALRFVLRNFSYQPEALLAIRIDNLPETVSITKLEAAQRQLNAAIRLFFIDEDELAVHTIASAAYRLINDLKDKQSMSEPADVYLAAVFYSVRDFRNGTLPKHIKDDFEMMDWIAKLAGQFPINAESNISDIIVTMDKTAIKAFWTWRNKASNFLKHADKDAEEDLRLNEVNNLQLLMQAQAALTDLVKNELSTEGFVLWLYSVLADGDVDTLPETFQSMGRRLLELHEDQRRSFCAALIPKLRGTGNLY